MSEYMDNQLEYEVKVERLNIFVYSLYAVLLAYISSRQDWGMLVFMAFVAGLAVCWSLYLTKSRSFRFRAAVTSACMLLGLYLFAMMSRELMSILPVMIAIVILVGLYEIPELIIICVGVTAVLYIHHGLIVQDIPFSDDWMTNLRIGLRLLSVFLSEYAAYYLVYNQKEGRRRQALFIEELKEAEQSRDDFLANVSHELRTPINTINGMSEMVLAENLTDEVRQDIFNIQSAGRNLLSVVSDILDYSELQAGQIEIVEESYNITSTINDIINMTMAKKEDKNIELLVDCDPYLPCSLKGDEQKIRRVIMNLVNNAVKYTQNGCVTIEIGYRREEYGINLTVGVKDTGIGMTSADIEKLFTGFGQIDTRRNRRDTGIGLGLAISSSIIDGMGGFISVESEYGAGTHIQFSIPQEVVDETPIASILEPQKIHCAVYFNMENNEMSDVREIYTRNFDHLSSGMEVDVTVCRNLGELKRRAERTEFTHVFITIDEYKEDMEFFHGLAERTKLAVALERWQEQELRSHRLLRLYKPFFVLPVALFLNNQEQESNAVRSSYHRERFIAPEAHILIVDDNLLNIKVAEGLLKPYMIKTSHALSGAEALEKIQTQDYDFVFMDHMMPEMDGIECLEHIREMEGSYYKEVPVVALTANAIGGTREMFLEKGFADFVAKPIELSVLERVLRRNLSPEKIQVITREEAIELGQRELDPPEQESAGQDSAGQKAAGSQNDGTAYVRSMGADMAEKPQSVPSRNREQGASMAQGYGETGSFGAGKAESAQRGSSRNREQGTSMAQGYGETGSFGAGKAESAQRESSRSGEQGASMAQGYGETGSFGAGRMESAQWGSSRNREQGASMAQGYGETGSFGAGRMESVQDMSSRSMGNQDYGKPRGTSDLSYGMSRGTSDLSYGTSQGTSDLSYGMSPGAKDQGYGSTQDMSQSTTAYSGGAADNGWAASAQSGVFQVGDLDVTQGELYCGGRENYLEVLELQNQDDKTLPKILDAYEKEDWKNYIILVHAVKSTMKSIGAQPLSDQAKALEFAGKASDIAFIHENQEAFVREYKRISASIAEFFAGDAEEEKSESSGLPDISEAEFAEVIESFESAMYIMDDAGMKDSLEYLERHSFGGKELKSELKNVAKKVEMSDYFSAFDVLQTVFDRLKKASGQEGGDR